MLVSFSVENFLSFNKKQTFCIEGGRVTKKREHLIIDGATKKELLCFAAIFGKNGAGKSNFIRAVATLRDFVVNAKLPQRAAKWWCLLDEKNESAPSSFEIVFIAGGTLYEYSLSIILSTGIIEKERLVRITGNRRTELFSREENGSYKFHHSIKGQKNDIEVLSQTFAMSGNPFLFSINHNTAGFYNANPQAKVLNTVFRWFSQTLEAIFPEQPLQETSLLEYDIKKDEFAKLLKEFDTGIEEIDLEPTTKEKVFENLDIKTQQKLNLHMLFARPLAKAVNQLSSQQGTQGEHSNVATVVRNRHNIFLISMKADGAFEFFTLKFIHNIAGKKVEFYMISESDGTHRLFQLLEILMTQKEKVFVMDEISRSLHPKLTIEFIKKYFKFAKNRRVQLFTTTHETRILKHDLVRRDEIWIADSNEDGSTKLFSLEEKQVRIDKVLDENYMSGEWGGTPEFEEEE